MTLIILPRTGKEQDIVLKPEKGRIVLSEASAGFGIDKSQHFRSDRRWLTTFI